jgi:predicted transcriptional regulator
MENKIAEEFIENEKERWERLVKKMPRKNDYNTLPEGESKITFTGEPEEEIASYEWNKGKNKGSRFHIIVPAILHLSSNNCSKVADISHSLGLSRTAFQSLFQYLQEKKSDFRLTGKKFTCLNKNNKSYTWKELKDGQA